MDSEVSLRDGSRIAIRQVRPDDAPLLAELYERLSPDSRRRRFLVAPAALSEEDLHHLTDVDHVRHEALLAIDAASDAAIGEARYVRTPGERESAEAAAMVADDWQRRGVATALLTELTERARANGVRRYTAVVAADNDPVLAALERQGARRSSAEGDEIELVVDFPPEGFPARLEAALGWAGRRQLRLLGDAGRRLASWPPR